MTVRALYSDRQAKITAKSNADAKVDADKQQLNLDTAAAADAETARVAAVQALVDGTPEGVIFPVEPAAAVLKLHGELVVLPIGDPDSEPQTQTAA